MLKTTASAFLLVSTACLGLTSTADARARRNSGQFEIVTADSRFGNGSVTGAVRPSQNGWEVQLPSGDWVGCRRSCEETLRVQTVDIFETNGRMTGYGTFQNQCGLLGCLELRYPR